MSHNTTKMLAFGAMAALVVSGMALVFMGTSVASASSGMSDINGDMDQLQDHDCTGDMDQLQDHDHISDMDQIQDHDRLKDGSCQL